MSQKMHGGSTVIQTSLAVGLLACTGAMGNAAAYCGNSGVGGPLQQICYQTLAYYFLAFFNEEDASRLEL